MATATRRPPTVVRVYRAQIDDVSRKRRSVTARINTGSIDRYRTIISPEGMGLDEYRANPVVLWEHGMDTPRGKVPIGRCSEIGRSKNAILATTDFHDDEFSRNIFSLYANETLRAFSVNVLPKEASPPTRDEIRRDATLAGCDMIYRKSTLAEYSAVSVPGNAEALAMDVSRVLGRMPDPDPFAELHAWVERHGAKDRQDHLTADQVRTLNELMTRVATTPRR